jgi:hypothetical protein
VPDWQPSLPNAVGGQTASTLAGTLSTRNNFNPAHIASVAPADAASYPVLATDALFTDPLLGDLFKEVL